MTGDRKKLPQLGQKGLDGHRIYNYRQWIDRYKQYTKRKYEIDIGPVIKAENKPGTDEWNIKQKDTKRFPVGTGTQSNAPNNKIQIPNRPRQN